MTAEVIALHGTIRWRGVCSCGEWSSRFRNNRELVEREAQWHDDSPNTEHIVSIRPYGVPR